MMMIPTIRRTVRHYDGNCWIDYNQMDDVDRCRCAFEAGRASTPKVSSSQAVRRDSLPVLANEMSSPRVRVGCIACQAAKGFAGAAFCGGAPTRLDLVQNYDRSELEAVAFFEGVAGLLVS